MVALALAAGCGGQTTGPMEHAPTATGGSESGTPPATGGATGITGASGAGGSCIDRSNAAAATISNALDHAGNHLSCAIDADCKVVSIRSDCTNSCDERVVSTSGAKTVQAAIDAANDGVCVGFLQQRCTVSEPPCVPSVVGAACVDGTCQNFPPQAWVSLDVAVGRGADATFSSPPPICPADHDCAVWTVTPDGSVAKIVSGASSTETLSTADFATVDGILCSTTFRQLFTFMPQVLLCDAAPPDIRVSIDLDSASGETGKDLTGCAVAGPSQNVVMQLYDVLQSY